jgi:outer membrane protein OmpA-like peptidoglycan-associated protein
MDHFVKSEGVAAWCGAAALCLPLLACAHDDGAQRSAPRQVAQPLVEPQVVPPPIAVVPPAPPSADVFVVSEDLRRQCGLPDALDDKPQFEFESADLRLRGKDILDRIAACVTEGSLQERGITVTGYPATGGTEPYELDLGLERARSTRDYLRKRGVAVSAVQVQSQGEPAATGTDDRNRHVVIDETR